MALEHQLAMDASINQPNLSADKTVRIFSQLRGIEIPIPQHEYDLVFSFLRKIYKTNTSASYFTNSLFEISYIYNVSIEELYNSLRGKTNGDIDKEISYYLNTVRHKSTWLGTANIQKPNFYSARNVKI